MRWLSRAAVAVVAAYAVVVGAAYGLQRQLLYLPPGQLLDPGDALPVVKDAPVRLAWRPAAPGKPTVVLFHGNNEQLASLTDRAPRFTERGLGVAAIEYPGYPGAPGEPSEQSLVAASVQGLEYLVAHGVPRDSLVLCGQSLGSGVAVALAAKGWGARLILLSPYTALPDVGQRQYPFLPVTLLMKDRFASLAAAPSVQQPALVIHGTADELIPVEQGRAVAGALPRATGLFVEGGQHNGLWRREGVFDAILDFAAAAP